MKRISSWPMAIMAGVLAALGCRRRAHRDIGASGRQDDRSRPLRLCRWFRMEGGNGYSPEPRLLSSSCPRA